MRSFRNALKMGHCAPAVMRTVREAQGANDDRAVRLAAGLPGGIGGLRSECGCVTSPVMILGMKYGDEADSSGIPKVVSKGQAYLKRFQDLNGGIHCREIMKTEANMLPCLKAICRSPEHVMDLLEQDDENGAVCGEASDAGGRLLDSFRERKFHCTHSVLSELDDVIDVDEKLLRASWGFVGGTVLQGQTCGALTAGVIAIGSKFGEIENSHLRVLGMMVRMTVGADAMRDDINKFNRSVNAGNRLGTWFEEEFASSRCSVIIKADLSTREGVDKYLSEGGIDGCRRIASKVAGKVREILKTPQ